MVIAAVVHAGATSVPTPPHLHNSTRKVVTQFVDEEVET